MIVSQSLQQSELMSVIWQIQQRKRYISHDDITKIAKAFDLSRMEVEGVISFYHFFHRQHAGNFTIYLNDSIVSQHAGMAEIKKVFEKELGIKTGEVTRDKMFGLFETACIGLSDQEPACLINFNAFTNLTPEKVRFIIRSLKEGHKTTEINDVPEANIRYVPTPDKTVFFKKYQQFSALETMQYNRPETIIEYIKASKLAGRGGAFFPTGLKWQFAHQNNADQKYLICNADEGEPGTFKDRVLMQEKPELMIEGMIIAAYAIGASKGYIYLRAEYLYLKPFLEKLLNDYRSAGFLGHNIPAATDFSFDISIHMGAGAYVCGEETALINSMEGRRGEPGNKTYFPVEKGFRNKPTVVNNVETLCAVPRILEMGVDKWLSIGTEKTPGTKIFSVSGDCDKPGIYEVEWGMKIKKFLKLIGAKDPYYILFNGYSGKCLSDIDFGRELSGEGILADDIKIDHSNVLEYKQKMSGIGVKSGGAFMVFNSKRDLLKIIQNINTFFVKESCGVCVPCRVGNYLLHLKLNKFLTEKAYTKDLKEIVKWSGIITSNSRCGLGIMSANALIDTIYKFPEIFEKHLQKNGDTEDAFDLNKATALYEQIIKEIRATYE